MAKAIDKTNAMRILDRQKVHYSIHTYLDSGVVSGIEVARWLKQDPSRVFKTLVTQGASKTHYVFLVPVDKELDLKKAAKCVGEKKIDMIPSKDLLPLTGYIHGGCSPVGMKKTFCTVIDQSAESFDRILFSGGKIGYQVELSLTDLKKAVDFSLQDIAVQV